MRTTGLRALVLLTLLLMYSCSAPRIAGQTTGETYSAPDAHWSVNFPFASSLCRVQDQQFPSQENVLFAPSIPLGLGVYQVAVTHAERLAGQEQVSDKNAWFGELLDRIAEFEGAQPRLLAAESAGEEPQKCWMRIYQLDDNYYLFLLRPLPPLSAGGVRGAVLFSLTSQVPANRNRIGGEPPLSLPLRSDWARLVEWSKSFVWHGVK